MSVIELRNVCLDYPLPHADGGSVKTRLFQFLRSPWVKAESAEFFRALTDITLTIASRERIGIIGLNGAGKSTLLRLLAGIFHPTTGVAFRRGRVSTLLDFATGFDPHHSGYENVRIRLMLLGESEKAIQRMLPEIVAFADIGDFIHRPAWTYSTGMFMRLAFAASTAITPEVLIADEIIGAGDLQFADKAVARVEQLLTRDSTIILSSHAMTMVRRFCRRAIWLHKGRIVADGDAEEVITMYEANGGVAP
jgi:ABC-type polysaccharide/polyol phosphate transport system ATPase subunit